MQLLTHQHNDSLCDCVGLYAFCMVKPSVGTKISALWRYVVIGRLVFGRRATAFDTAKTRLGEIWHRCDSELV